MAHKDTSRRDAAYGKGQMSRFRKQHCVVFGVKGVGIECAKNLCLTGPASVTISDDEMVTIADLGANFYLKVRALPCSMAVGGAPASWPRRSLDTAQ